MRWLIIAGALFWSVIAFFGARRAFREHADKPVGLAFARIRRSAPGGLLFPALCGFVLCALFVSFEIAAVTSHAGVIGPRFMLGVLSGAFGAICLAGQFPSR